MIWVLIFIFTFYAILIISLTIGFKKVDEFNEISKNNSTSFSVVIPFRNEAKNLPNLLASISKINYSNQLLEFILVDDASSDNSVEIINNFLSAIPNKISKHKNKSNTLCLDGKNIRIIKNKRISNSPKKDAITTAISIAKNNWILTTDADCILPINWLKSLDNFIQDKKPNIVVAPVNYKVENNFLAQFQLLDFMSMQGCTIGGFGVDFPFLCNGANLAYSKEEFLNLNGFEGNNTIASGDDIFLLEKILQKCPEKVCYLKANEAIVETSSEKTWPLFLNQQLRWASKTTAYNNWFSKFVGLTVFIENLLVITLGVSTLFISEYWKYFVIVFISKFLAFLQKDIKIALTYKFNIFMQIFSILFVNDILSVSRTSLCSSLKYF